MFRYVSIAFTFIIMACQPVSTPKTGGKAMSPDNPFYSNYEIPPFASISFEHFKPAFEAGMQEHNKEIQAIAENSEPATIINTLDAFDHSGQLLERVSTVYFNLLGADTNDQLQALAKEISPRLSEHFDNIMLNEKLFARFKSLYDQKETLHLTTEQNTYLTKLYKEFVRGGANLPKDKKQQLLEINKKLSLLSVQFGENVLKEDNNFMLVLDKKDDLAGLPPSVIDAAAIAAEKKELTGKWVFTLHKPSLIPFLQYSNKRNLREKMLMAYAMRGDNNNEYDNKHIAAEMASLRYKKAQLLGYKTHAHYILEENMAKEPKLVYGLLAKVWPPALKQAHTEIKQLQNMLERDIPGATLQPWDWWYYAEKLRKAKYNLDEEALRPYFKLENVQQGAFYVCNKLYGITFKPLPDVKLYHPEVKAYEVQDANNQKIGVLFIDYHPRESKRGGAWMSHFRKQHKINGEMVTPVIANVYNFTRPTKDLPALLTLEEVTTLFHELGHGLHGLLSNINYQQISGTSVPRDFVELPSQVLENWATEPSVLAHYAKHYKTGKVMPQALIDKMQKSKFFNQGFITVEYMAAAYLDMAWHTLETEDLQKTNEFEKQVLAAINMPAEIIVRYRSTNFKHIFSGGYSSGYYSYMWSQVLDADAFAAFQETGLFNPKTAKAFYDNVLTKGGSNDPQILYKEFRGKDPSIDPLLKRKGFIN